METENVVTILNERRADLTYDDFAREIGIKTPTLFRLLTGRHGMGVDSIRYFARWAKRQRDIALINALASYALGFELNPDDLARAE